MKITGKYPNTRLRRVRKSSWFRNLISQNSLTINDLILPIFVCEGKNRVKQLNPCKELTDILLTD